MSDDSSGDHFADLARTLSNQPDVTATLGSATAAALTLVVGCDHAGISLVTKGKRIETVAPTSALMIRADELQYETSEGPCIQSIEDQETVYAPDLRQERRWLAWATAVSSELGIRSVLSLRLFVERDSIGCLNMYSERTHAFDYDNRSSALALAAHVAVALSAEQVKDRMKSALVNRVVIGRAEGRIMQAYGVTAPQAFSALVRASQTRNKKLHVIAAEIAENGLSADTFGPT